MTRALLLVLLTVPAIAAPRAVEWRHDGRIHEARGNLFSGAGPEAAAALVRSLGSLVRDPGDGTEIRELGRRESLTGTHVRFGQFLDGEPILGAEIVLRFDARGELASLSNRLAVHRPAASASHAPRIPEELAGKAVRREQILFADDGVVRRALRLVVPHPPFGEIAHDVDPATGRVLRVIPDFWLAQGARVFAANPVTTLNDTTLRDDDDSALAVPPQAYADVDLLDLGPGPGLRGPRVEVVDLESPKTGAADPGGVLLFDRASDAFEDVMAYHHLDASIRYIESLGYAGPRAIFTRAVRADAHAVNGADQSFYRWGAGGVAVLLFGDGGVDDAEDPDILLHELGHAIQDAIAPFAFAGSYGSEARAVGEGLGDYWAFSAGYEASLVSGRDAFCVGDWDARCSGGSCGYPAGSDCLRRVDSPKTMAEFLAREQSGVEHQNGEIWSSALREVFLAAVARAGVEEGRRIADTIVLESHFGVPPNPTFRTMGRRMLEADRLLFAGANEAAICAAMTTRGIFANGDCDLIPRAETTLFQAPAFELGIPDGSAAGVRSTLWIGDDRRIAAVRVPVRIRHPFRGELRIELTAPDGRTFILKQAGADSGADIDTTYGLDAEPADPLAPLAGMSARGAWTLAVVDTRALDEGVLVSWGVELAFEGSAPLATRGLAAGATLHLPALAHTPGAAGTFFVSDARVLNASDEEKTITLLFTPSGADGGSVFAAREIVVAAWQQVALDDLVSTAFRSTGTGALELRGETGGVLLTSRTYNDAPEGTFGQFVPGSRADDAMTAAGGARHILGLRNDDAFRSNLGFAEVGGGSGMVAWSLFDASGRAIEEGSLHLAPWSHAQVPLLGGFGGSSHRVVRALVRVVSGTARAVAYGSLVDNATGDGVFLPAERARSDARGDIAAVIRSEGAFGTAWRSDLWIANPGAAEETFALRWTSPGGATREAQVEVAAGATAALEDIIASLFGSSAGVGALRIETDAPEWAATARVWTAGERGTHGQRVPVSDGTGAAGAGERPLVIAHLDHGGEFRTNIGVAETGGAEAVARIRLRNAAGEDVWETVVTVPAHEQRQVALLAAGAPAVANGYAVIEVVGGAGRVVAYGSVIDNRTGDPVYIPAEATQ